MFNFNNNGGGHNSGLFNNVPNTSGMFMQNQSKNNSK